MKKNEPSRTPKTLKVPKSSTIRSGLNETIVKQISERLSILTADLHVLSVKTLRCHWNIVDPRFSAIHELLAGQYKLLAEDTDEVAERIRKLGGFAPGSLREFLTLTRLDELTSNPSGNAMLATLAESHEMLIPHLREDVEFTQNQGDPGSADLLTQLVRHHEKAAWVLRSHL